MKKLLFLTIFSVFLNAGELITYLKSLDQNKVCNVSEIKDKEVRNFQNFLCSLEEKRERILGLSLFLNGVYSEKYEDIVLDNFIPKEYKGLIKTPEQYAYLLTMIEVSKKKTNLFNPVELENFYNNLSFDSKKKIQEEVLIPLKSINTRYKYKKIIKDEKDSFFQQEE